MDITYKLTLLYLNDFRTLESGLKFSFCVVGEKNHLFSFLNMEYIIEKIWKYLEKFLKTYRWKKYLWIIMNSEPGWGISKRMKLKLSWVMAESSKTQDIYLE